MNVFRIVAILATFVFLAGCHHNVKPQALDTAGISQVQVMPNLMDSMASMDMADFARRY